MSRTLSTATDAAVAATTTQPGYLVHIAWSTPSRLTSGRSPLNWNGYVWLATDIRVDGLKWDKAGQQTGSLTLGNSEQQFSALALNEGVADVPVSIWAYDRSATAAGDPVLVFSGVGGKLAANDDRLTLELTTQRSRALKCPRMRITAANGFNYLPVAGSSIRWGNERYVLRPR